MKRKKVFGKDLMVEHEGERTEQSYGNRCGKAFLKFQTMVSEQGGKIDNNAKVIGKIP